MRETLKLSKSAYPKEVQKLLDELDKRYYNAIAYSNFESAARLADEWGEVTRTLNILALIGKGTIQNTELEKQYFAYLAENDKEKKEELKNLYIAMLSEYGTDEKEQSSELAVWIGESDSKTCDTCQDLKGTTYKVGEVPPPHPNCRCEVRYISNGASKYLKKQEKNEGTQTVLGKAYLAARTTLSSTEISAFIGKTNTNTMPDLISSAAPSIPEYYKSMNPAGLTEYHLRKYQQTKNLKSHDMPK